MWRAQKNRRKPQIFAGNRRKLQIGLRHLRSVTFSSALILVLARMKFFFSFQGSSSGFSGEADPACCGASSRKVKMLLLVLMPSKVVISSHHKGSEEQEDKGTRRPETQDDQGEKEEGNHVIWETRRKEQDDNKKKGTCIKLSNLQF